MRKRVNWVSSVVDVAIIVCSHFAGVDSSRVCSSSSKLAHLRGLAVVLKLRLCRCRVDSERKLGSELLDRGHFLGDRFPMDTSQLDAKFAKDLRRAKKV